MSACMVLITISATPGHTRTPTCAGGPPASASGMRGAKTCMPTSTTTVMVTLCAMPSGYAPCSAGERRPGHLQPKTANRGGGLISSGAGDRRTARRPCSRLSWNHESHSRSSLAETARAVTDLLDSTWWLGLRPPSTPVASPICAPAAPSEPPPIIAPNGLVVVAADLRSARSPRLPQIVRPAGVACRACSMIVSRSEASKTPGAVPSDNHLTGFQAYEMVKGKKRLFRSSES